MLSSVVRIPSWHSGNILRTFWESLISALIADRWHQCALLGKIHVSIWSLIADINAQFLGIPGERFVCWSMATLCKSRVSLWYLIGRPQRISYVRFSIRQLVKSWRAYWSLIRYPQCAVLVKILASLLIADRLSPMRSFWNQNNLKSLGVYPEKKFWFELCYVVANNLPCCAVCVVL